MNIKIKVLGLLFLILTFSSGVRAQLTTTSSPDTAICPSSSVQLFTSPSGGTSYSYSWSPTTGLSSATIANPVATPAVSTTYVVTITDIPTSNTVTDTINVVLQNIPPPVIIRPQSDTICAGDTLQLCVVNSGSCNAIPGTCRSTTTTSTLGSGTFFGSSRWENPFYKRSFFFLQVRSNKRQIIYTKAELNNAGIVGQTNLTSLSFNFNTGGNHTYTNFRINMGCTNATTFGAYQSGLSNVFTPQTVTINSSGWKEFVFESGFNWDGESNIVVELCYVNAAASNGVPAIQFEVVSGNVARHTVGNTDVCGNSGGTNFTRRPNMRFKHCELVHTSALTYLWTPATGLSSTTARKPFANPASSTAYKVTVTDANGCTISDTADITVAPSFNLSVNADTVMCSDDTLALLSTDNAGAGAVYKWTAGATIANDSVPNTTAYFNASSNVSLSVTSVAGCQKTESFSVSLNAPVDVEILTADTSICAGDSIPIDVTTNAQGCQSYNWINCTNENILTFTGTSAFPSGGVTISPYDAVGASASPGQKKQYIILASELAVLSDKKSISSLGFNLVSTGNASKIRQGFTIKMTCTSLSSFPGFGGTSFVQGAQTVYTPKNITISTGWNDYSFDSPFVWDGTSNVIVEICWQNSSSIGFGFSTLNYSFMAANRTAIRWNSTNVCSDTTANFTSTIRPEMRFKFCDSPPNPMFSYQWAPSAGLNFDTIPRPTAGPTVTTNYILTVTDPGSGCFDEDTLVITVAPDFVTNVTPDSILCVDDSLQLSVTHNNPGPVTYKWQPAADVSNSGIFNPFIYVNDSKQIISEVESSQGCIKWDTLNFGIQDVIDIGITLNTNLACEDDSVQFLSTHTLACGKSNSTLCATLSTINIGTSTFTSSQFNISPFVATDLSVRRQFMITVAELNAAGISTSGQLTSLSFDITTLGKIDYQNFRIKMGCTSANQLSTTFTGGLVTVFEPKDVTLVTGLNWYDFDNRFNWDGVSNIVVEVCYQNIATGVSSEIHYTQPFPLYNCVSYNRGNSVCGNSSATLYNRRANIGFRYCSYVPTNFIYDWFPNSLFNDPNIQNPIGFMSQPGKYILHLTDLSTGCILKDSIEVPLVSFSVQAFKDTTLCSSMDYDLSVVTDATQPKYLWTPGWEVSIDTIANPKVIVDNGTVFIANVYDSSGCVKSDTVFITLLPNPTISISNDVSVCRGKDVQLVGGGGDTYLWTPPDGLSDPTSSNPTATVLQSTTYTLTVANTFGCTDEDSVTITVFPSPYLNLGPDTSYCLGGYLELNAGGDFATYRWQDNSSDSIYLAADDGKYWVVVNDVFNCTFSDTVVVSLAPPPVTDIRYLTEICEGDSTILDALNPGSTYLWSTGETVQQIIVRDSGFYWVEIDDGTCPGKDSTNVVILEYPISTLPNMVAYCAKEDPFGVTLKAGSEEYKYVWSNGQFTNSIVVNEEGYYWVKVTNGADCEITRGTEVVEFCKELIFVPSSFTPNSDQINDIFKISAGNLDDFEFHLFDRWGGLIFISQHPDFEWDGTKGGQPVPEGVYVWKLFYKIKESDGSMSEKEKIGSLTLIR